MKKVVSVSLGSSQRDHTARVQFLGQELELSREGTDGDIDRAEARIRELDGKVDAIGLGGLDIYLYAGGVRYVVRDGIRLMEAAKTTPIVDGSSIKNTLERDAVRDLARRGLVDSATRVLMVSAVDRFGMAEAFSELGSPTTFGDLIFAAGIPYPIRTLGELAEIARKILPDMAKLPLAMLYPQGKSQEEATDPKFQRYYDAVDLIAGDWHLIRKYLPSRVDGKAFLTNTTTPTDVALLRERGAKTLITTTPVLGGRSFGTNLMEAAIVALSGERPDEIGEEGFRSWLDRLDLFPTVTPLGG